jgi:hypothetical protein
MNGTKKTRHESRSRIVNSLPEQIGQNARNGVEKTLQENYHMVATTKPIYNGNKLWIERRRTAGKLGESVFDKPTRDLSIRVRIAHVLDQIIEAQEN